MLIEEGQGEGGGEEIQALETEDGADEVARSLENRIPPGYTYGYPRSPPLPEARDTLKGGTAGNCY